LRLLIFHGYLLGGTGSNVYNARLVEALVRLGHEVHLLSQERHPEQHPFLAAAGDWDSGELRVRELDGAVLGPGRATLYRPDLGGLLPVYVADRYEGLQAKTFADCTAEEIDRYLAANVAAVEQVTALARPQLALANHLVMGPVILARALGGAVPYAVKVHGSALEYTVKPNPQRFLAPAREGLAPARGVLVGSHHTAASLWQAIGDERLPDRTRLGPPGVDVARFAPREPAAAAAGLRELADRLRGEPAPADGAEGPASAFARDPREAAAAVARLADGDGPLVAFVGKLIVSKGVDLLVASWPLVLSRLPSARLAVVGFGAYRDGLRALAAALRSGDIEEARRLALAGRALEDPAAPAVALRLLLAFLDSLHGAERERYLAATATLEQRIVWTGRLEHEELADLLPACTALVAPSTFPEAFGMVAAEGAACGAVPVVARHSGLAEVSEALAAAVPAEAEPWLSFALGDSAVRALADCLLGCLTAEPGVLERTREGLVETVRERWSWERVAAGVIAAASGELEQLQRP
jgi:glycosyltransferase involved in cell wall biosynthesis